jgi:hypothetical protein
MQAPNKQILEIHEHLPNQLGRCASAYASACETEVIDVLVKIVADFIAARSTPIALRDGVLYVCVLQPALHYELEQISKSEILRKGKQRFGAKTIRDIRFRIG